MLVRKSLGVLGFTYPGDPPASSTWSQLDVVASLLSPWHTVLQVATGQCLPNSASGDASDTNATKKELGSRRSSNWKGLSFELPVKEVLTLTSTTVIPFDSLALVK